MALGATLKFDDVAAEFESTLNLGGGISRFNAVGAQIDDSVQDLTEDSIDMRPLEWTKAPFTQVQKEGNVRYQVSTPATASDRAHNLHLVRSVRLEPRPSSRSCSRRPSRSGEVQAAIEAISLDQWKSRRSSRPSSRQSSLPPRQSSGSRPPSRQSSRPPSCSKKDEHEGRCQEEIVVTEADLRRCGHSLTLLRQCNQHQPHDGTKEALHNKEMTLSFKSAYMLKCRQGEPRNPWKDVANPEETREQYEQDLILNQVWTERMRPKRVEPDAEASDDSHILGSPQRIRRTASASTRASSTDSPAGISRQLSVRDAAGSRGRKGSRRPPQLRAQSSGPTAAHQQAEPHRAETRALSRGRRGNHSSGCPRPGLTPPGTASKQADDKRTSKYESRIKLIEDNSEEEEELVQPKGSLAVRAQSVNQRRFERQVEEQPLFRTVWLSLDPLTGEVEFYPKAAAQRLESAHVHRKAHVPLAGLGGDLEWAIVYLGHREENGQSCPTQLLNGEHRDVRRMTVPFDATWVTLRVAQDSRWRIADVPNVQGTIEERHVSLAGSHLMCRAPSPTLPPVDPNRRLQFHNPGVPDVNA